MFQSEAGGSAVRSRAEIVAGQMRQKGHLTRVQECPDEGAAKGWRLVSTTTTNATTIYVTGIYWDTTRER